MLIILEQSVMYESLKKEFEHYLENQEAFVNKHNGKYIVIKDLTVIGEYDDELEAVQETSKTHELGTFIVQKCEPGIWEYTAIFSSDRVSFKSDKDKTEHKTKPLDFTLETDHLLLKNARETATDFLTIDELMTDYEEHNG